jgi:NAD(P)H-dependent FMN reductase
MSKILILGSGTSNDSKNNLLANYAQNYLSNQKVESYLYSNLYSDIPFLLEKESKAPLKIIEMRNALIICDKVLIFSPVFNGGYLAHLKNTLDWLSLSFEDFEYNQLFKKKYASVVSSVNGSGGNAQTAFEILKIQLENYGFNVNKNFLLINKDDYLDNELNFNLNVSLVKKIEDYLNLFLEI